MPKRYLSSLLLLMLFVSGTHAYGAFADYLQISNSEDQLTTMDNLNKGIVVILDKPDGISGISWDPKTNEAGINQDGVYFIMAVAQMGARESASDIVKGGDAYLWFELNKKPIANGSNWIFVSPTAKAHTIVDQLAMAFKAGDKIRIKLASSSPSVGLITFPATELWPASSGISLTIYKIGDLPQAIPSSPK
jgi:hypothetical protein